MKDCASRTVAFSNRSPGGYDLIRYYKRPSYCAGSYAPAQGRKGAVSKPTDARGKARHLQHISLRRGK
ncbi:hypothetical protein COCON_G00070400 [Conger conger]|uniref:Uncharacterized protein n=1 Tax=Conger conger TaxID=82655 RepID=A0A9Q1DTP4_CONCO|nr:hypothetical protein COCON_G00070400 [Conger conger]